MIIRRFVTILCVFLSIQGVTEAGFWDNVKGMIWNSEHKTIPKIDILIINDQPGTLLEVRGKYKIYDPNTKRQISKRFLGKRKYMQSIASGLKWGEEFPGIYQLMIVPEDTTSTIILDGVEYRGSIIVYDIGGTISIVNRIPVEEFLLAVLPQQFKDPMPEETLSAIAIAARTNAYFQARNPRNQYWSVEADAVGYHGVPSGRSNSEMVRALETTRHMILSKTGAYEGAVSPFPAQWGSVTGGMTGNRAEFSRISLFEAEDMGMHGNDAAQILSRAFPGSHIELIY